MRKSLKAMLLKQIATRDRLGLLRELYDALPDPDKILEENGYDYSVLRDLQNDAHLMATIQQRKMQVLQMGWEVQYETDEKIKKEAIEIMRELPLGAIMNNILDAIFFGYSVGEVEWKFVNDKIIPVNVIGKPQEWFIFNKKNELMMRKRVNGSYVFGEGEPIPKNKFILAQYQPSYNNPYGEKVLSRCYWPVNMKKDGVEAWQLMMQRFGMPYLIGRYAAGATEAEKEQLLEDLQEMVMDSISVFEVGKEVEIKESPTYNVGGLYENLVGFQNAEISKAVLTVTLTTEVGNTGSYKAAEIHREMLNYLGVTDKKIVERALNTLFEYYVELNYGKLDAPRIKLNKKEAVIDESAERDRILKELGVNFTKEYYKKRYNLTDTDFELRE